MSEEEYPIYPNKATKTQLANQYGRTWRSIRPIIHEILPELKGTRRRILLPVEIKEIYKTYGYPEEFQNPDANL